MSNTQIQTNEPIPSATIPTTASSVDTAIRDYEAANAAWRSKQSAALAKTKPILFGALQAAGIARVTLTFEGSGDSGQIEWVQGYGTDDQIVDLSDATITYPAVSMDARYEPCAENPNGKQFVGYDVNEVEKTEPISAVIENIFWDFIGDRHGGWENDDGGFGECHFEVEHQIIRLEMNERYTETNYSEHEW